MKYWFFDGNDVIGPFTASELVAHKSFGATSLICPENFSEDGNQWQPAIVFAEIKALLKEANSNSNDPASLEEEMDSLLKEKSPISFDETPTDGTGLEIPKKPSKPGPIEDYFDNIKGEDLGNILGIPDPNDNSDMDLAHALEKQLAKTSSTRREQQQTNAEQQEPAQDPRETTHHVATVTEVFHEVPSQLNHLSTNSDSQKMPMLPPSTLPTLAAEEKNSNQRDLRPLSEHIEQNQSGAPKEQVIPSADFATPSATPPSSVEEPAIIPNPALLRAEKVEVNSVRPRLRQTKEMKDFLNETQNSHLKKQYKTQRKIVVMLLVALAILAALMGAMQFKRLNQTPAAPVPTAPTPTTPQELLQEDTPAPLPVPTEDSVSQQELSQEQKALEIVQNHLLSGNRGTLANYLSRLYKTQLAQGYTAAWGVEPLYKNTYIVKYRLTKTRKEPIIYVFQADVAANKLTGALNNISLDLVGKI